VGLNARCRAALAVVGLVASATLAGCSGGGSEAPVAATGSWQDMSPAPIAGRSPAASVWTGKEMVVWGGGSCKANPCQFDNVEPLADGGAYDPVADTWRSIAQGPLAARTGTAFDWSGKELLVWGGGIGTTQVFADGAAYDPAADSWRPLPPSPLTARRAKGVWTGRELLVWGGRDIVDTKFFADGAAYDPVANSWRMLPPVELSARERVSMISTGKEVVVFGGGTSNEAFGDGAAYDPVANSWRMLPQPPFAPRFVEANWTGKEILYWGGEDWAQVFDDGAAYDPAANRWRPLPSAALRGRVAAAHVWTGREMLIWGGTTGTFNTYLADGAAYAPESDSWRPLPTWTGRFVASDHWTGREMVIWGGTVPTGAPGRAVEIKSAADGRRYVP